MSVRPPNLAILGQLLAGRDQLDAEIAAEKASALGRAGRALEKAMAAYHAAEPGDAKTALAYRAAEAVLALFVQRESMGQRSHAEVVRHYGVPNEILAKVGAMPGK